MILLCRKKYIVAKSKEEKIGSNLADSSKVGHGSKRAVLSMMMMIQSLEVNSEIVATSGLYHFHPNPF
jgi:hypothetical protein